MLAIKSHGALCPVCLRSQSCLCCHCSCCRRKKGLAEIFESLMLFYSTGILFPTVFTVVFVSVAVHRALYVLSHLILTVAIWRRFYYYNLYFIDKEMETMSTLPQLTALVKSEFESWQPDCKGCTSPLH